MGAVNFVDIRKIEISFEQLNECLLIEFDVLTNTKYPVWSKALRYKEVFLDYLNYIEVNLTEDILRNIFSRNELNRLIRGNFFGIILFTVFAVYLLKIALTMHFFLAFLLSVSFFVLSIPSIKKFVKYGKIKNIIYN